jgi:hypothetical protein
VRFVGGPTSGVAPLTVYLDGSGSKPAADGTWIARCNLRYGDGTTADNCYALHTYGPGQYTAVFTATDNLGRTASAELVIAVSPSADGGTADAGTPTPIDAGSPTPVDAGTPPDAGTPTAALTWFGSEQGMPWARSVSADEGGNLWAVNDTGIYTQSAGQTRFTFHSGVGQLARGDWPYAICGGAAGQAYVGYVSPENLPVLGGTPEQRLRGDLDRVALTTSGAVTLQHHYQLVNTNDPRYDEVRTVVSCVRQNDRSSPYYGEVYLGSNHAVTRIRGDGIADHRHVVFANAQGSLVIGYNWATALSPNGNLFFANEYKVGILRPTASLPDWLSFSVNPWALDTYASVLGPIEDPDRWHAAAVTPDGKHWVGSWGKGLLWMTPSPRVWKVVPGTPDTQINALAAEANSTLWVGTHNAGLWKLTAGGQEWTRVPLPTNRVLGLEIDVRSSPRTLLIATDRGIGVYRGP